MRIKKALIWVVIFVIIWFICLLICYEAKTENNKKLNNKYLIIWLEWRKVDLDKQSLLNHPELLDKSYQIKGKEQLQSKEIEMIVYSKPELIRKIEELIKRQKEETEITITDVEIYRLQFIPMYTIFTNKTNF